VGHGEKGALSVRGKLKEDGIELNGLAYKEYSVNTDLVEERNSYRLNRNPSLIDSEVDTGI